MGMKGALSMSEKKKKRRGDRFDATLVRGLDPLHWFMPYLYPNRADNEAFIREDFDLTNLEAYLEKKNAGLDKAHRYTIFHAVAAALVKAVTLRPNMNRFIQGRRLYQRDELSLAFVVKKQFKDDAKEALAFIKFPEDTTIDSLHARILEEIPTIQKKYKWFDFIGNNYVTNLGKEMAAEQYENSQKVYEYLSYIQIQNMNDYTDNGEKVHFKMPKEN